MPSMPALHPVILCGGSGTRLWPLSRKSYPKQFVPLLGEDSLFQGSLTRVSAPEFAAPLIVTSNDYRFIALEQMAALQITPQAIVIEPEARNTAPAILATALHLAATNPQAMMLVTPSDHVIPDAAGFRATVLAAMPTAQAGQIITFGITPTRPETGYGYLEPVAGSDAGTAGPRPLKRFVEKPDAARAAQMLAEGLYLWNAGIFLFTAQTMIDAFTKFAPDMLDAARAAVDDATHDLAFTRLAPGPWAGLRDESIDYAIMERADNLSVMPFTGAWSDLGGWEAVWQETGPDGSGNVVSDHATAIDCTGSLLRSESEDLELVGIGLKDLIAVATPDAIVIAPRHESQRVKEAVAALKARGAKQATEFRRDHRPWGWFETLALGGRFQVKRIVVHPGAALSLQSHHHRSEHWIVVEGTAKVTVNETIQLITENQSVYVPLGAVHRMENPGRVPMVLIEVQTGIYLGEDDIIRYEDVYARGQGAKG